MSKLPTAILFDLDDTILAAFGQAEGQWRRVVAAFIEQVAPHPPADVVAAIQTYSRHMWADATRHKNWRPRIGEARRHIVAKAFAGLASAAGGSVPPSEVCEAIADQFNRLHDAELHMFPGAHETLDRLKQLGVRLALVTNGASGPQRAKVIRFALEERFDLIQIEGEHGFGKPEERAYTHAMEALGVESQETWMVGDNLEWEIAAPQRLGIYAVWLDAYHIGLPPNCAVQPDRIIHSLPELLR
jgi:putative hydrolase of the HAD superfamily